MPITNIPAGSGGGIVTEEDPSALKKANNLSDLTNVESAKATLGISTIKIADYDNGKTYAAGDQVVFANKLYRFNSFIGAAGYGPDTHPWAWTEISKQASDYLTKKQSFSEGNQTQYAVPILATQFNGVTFGSGAVSDHFNAITNATNSATRRLFAPTTGTGYAGQQLDLNIMSNGVDHFNSLRGFNWGRKMSISFSVAFGSFASTGDSNTRFMAKIGFNGVGASLFSVGKGIGFIKIGSGPLIVEYLREQGLAQTVTTSFNPGAGVVYNYVMEFDGLGAFSLSVDGNKILEGPYAPIGQQNSNTSYPVMSALSFFCENTATTAVRAVAAISFVKVSIVDPVIII